jgi:hypothetical protein
MAIMPFEEPNRIARVVLPPHLVIRPSRQYRERIPRVQAR